MSSGLMLVVIVVLLCAVAWFSIFGRDHFV